MSCPSFLPGAIVLAVPPIDTEAFICGWRSAMWALSNRWPHGIDMSRRKRRARYRRGREGVRPRHRGNR